MKKIEVVAAIILFEGQILCAQRGESKLTYVSEKFEFPGGKIEEGESQEEALRRELIEELKIEPFIKEKYLTVVHEYPDFELTMHSYLCEAINKEVTLEEHKSSQWLSHEDLLQLDWAAADIPIVNKLMNEE